MKLIVGMGNPGDRYMNSRRNIGFKIIDIITINAGIPIKTKKKKSLLGVGDFEGHEVVLLKPQTFYNLSGEAVLYIASFMKIPLKDIIVIHDDYSLEFGKIKPAFSPPEIPHAGIESIISALNSWKFARIRVGVGPPPSDDPAEIEEFLLEDFKLEETVRLVDVINRAESILRDLLNQGVEDVLSRTQMEGS